MRKKKKRSYPKTKIKKGSVDLLNFAITNVIMYMEIEKDAKAILIRNKQLTPFLNMKLQLEMDFCGNVLKNLFGVSGAEVLRIGEKLRESEAWAEEVDAFIDTVSPGSTKKIRLFNEQDFRGELANQDRTGRAGKVVKGGKILI